MTYSRRFVLHPGPIAWGVGTGLLLVVGMVLTFALPTGDEDGLMPVLSRALIIYLPAGLTTGLRLRRLTAGRRGGNRPAPAAFQALVAGLVLTILHGIILWIANGGVRPGLAWFITEGLLAAVIASVGGLLAGRWRLSA